MSEEEIKLDRYAKFRKLGHYEDFPVLGGAWKETRAERAAVRRLPLKPCFAPGRPFSWLPHGACAVTLHAVTQKPWQVQSLCCTVQSPMWMELCGL